MKKKKINQNFRYEIRNLRTTQEREKIELGNGEETKNDNERERERAYRFMEVEAGGEERKNVKKKTGYLGLFTGSKKRGMFAFKKKKKKIKFGYFKKF